jgi:DNA-binding SARP family transcriptional activator
MAEVTFGLMGPMLINHSGESISISASRQRVLLAALLLRPNQPVPKQRLREAIWPEADDRSDATLRSYVMRLRRILGPMLAARLTIRPAGYLLTLDNDEELDVLQFQACIRRGRQAAVRKEWELALREFQRALELWRGDPLCDVPSDYLQLSASPVLFEQRMQAWEGLCAAASRLGRMGDHIVGLQQLAEEEPLSERCSALLMTALRSANRRIDALSEFRRLRQLLIREQGVEPSGFVRDIHEQLLRDGAEVTGHAATSRERRRPVQPACGSVPRQLPAGPALFLGRSSTFAELTKALARSKDGGASGPKAFVITGPPGIGKTALALQAAGRIRHEYPAGQLYADLQGSQPRPAAAGAVMARFLRALGASPAELAPGGPERVGQYRSLLADRAVLIVLDDARDAAQVRSLLPGPGPSSVLITSRYALSDLPEVHNVGMTELNEAEALALFAESAGPERVRAEPDAAAAVLAVCAGLPLALRIAGARLSSRPEWPIGHLAQLLADERNWLNELRHGSASVRTSLESAYGAMAGSGAGRTKAGEHAARVFERLGRWQVSHFSTAQAAYWLGLQGEVAAAALEYAVDAGLLRSFGANQYWLPGLIRVFAQECASAATSDPGILPEASYSSWPALIPDHADDMPAVNDSKLA